MRFVAYRDGLQLPIIEYADEPQRNLTILGARFLGEGDIALHCLKMGKDIVVIAHSDCFFDNLEDAMEGRFKEIRKKRNPFQEIAKPAIKKRNEDAILHQENHILWAMMLDPE